VNDDLLDAAMRSDTIAIEEALNGKADPNAPRDMYDYIMRHTMATLRLSTFF